MKAGSRWKQIAPQRKGMMLEIAQGDYHLGVVLFNFNSHRRCDEMLAWLIRNRITGKELRGFMKFYCKNSILLTMGEICMRIDKGQEMTPILVGRDFVPVAF